MAKTIQKNYKIRIYNSFDIQFSDSISFNDQTIYFVIGPNGIGKSSFAKAISQFESYKTIQLKDTPISFILHTQEVIYLPGSISENFDIFCSEQKRNELLNRMFDNPEIIKTFQNLFQKYQSTSFSLISGGEKQLLSLLRSLIVYERKTDFDGIIYDEPSTQLSFDLKKQLITILIEVNILNPQIIISHDFHFINGLISKIIRNKSNKQIIFLNFEEKNVSPNEYPCKIVSIAGNLKRNSTVNDWIKCFKKSPYLSGMYGFSKESLENYSQYDNTKLGVDVEVLSVSPHYGGFFKLCLTRKGVTQTELMSFYKGNYEFILCR